MTWPKMVVMVFDDPKTDFVYIPFSSTHRRSIDFHNLIFIENITSKICLKMNTWKIAFKTQNQMNYVSFNRISVRKCFLFFFFYIFKEFIQKNVKNVIFECPKKFTVEYKIETLHRMTFRRAFLKKISFIDFQRIVKSGNRRHFFFYFLKRRVLMKVCRQWLIWVKISVEIPFLKNIFKLFLLIIWKFLNFKWVW